MLNLVQKTIVTDTSAYASGDSIGGLITVPGGCRPGQPVLLKSIVIADKDKQAKAMDLVIFRDNPTASTITDQAAFSLAAADAAKVVAVIRMDSGGYNDLGSASIENFGYVEQVIQAAKGLGDFYVALVARDTPTFTTAAGLVLSLGIEH